MNNLIRMIYVISISSLLMSCGNNLGPENDPGIKIELMNDVSAHFQPDGLHKQCTFLAKVIGNHPTTLLPRLKPVSNVWDEEISVFCDPGLEFGTLVYVDAVALIEKDKEEARYDWEYYQRGY